MWDVIWTDPNKELVGEHRAKKEKKRSPESDPSSKDHAHMSSRSSFSTRNSVSSSDAALSFIRSQTGIKKAAARNKEHSGPQTAGGKGSWRSASWSKASSTASSALASLSITSTRSPLSPTFDIRSRRSSGLATTNESSLHSRPSIASRITKETEDSMAGDDQAADYGLTTSSMEKTGALASGDPLVSKEHRLLSSGLDISVAANDSHHESCTHPRMDNSLSTEALTTEPNTAPLETLAQTLTLGLTKSSAMPEPCSPPPVVPPKSPLRPTSRSCAVMTVPGDWEGWLSADGWPQRAPSTDGNDDLARNESKMLDMSVLTDELTEMAAAGPEHILSRLKVFAEQELTVSQELERKRWLMCALQHMDHGASRVSSDDNQASSGHHVQEVLILFESSNTAAYYAAQAPTKNFYHVARYPLRNATFSNIIPLSLPSISTEILGHALPSGLDQLCSTSLPSLCPAPDLTRMLICLRSHLKPTVGALHLTLIDALPHPATLGPHLRGWLERNLLINLTPHSLSHTPTRLFPKCLAAASLRGAGSRRVKTKFFASSVSIRGSAVSDEEKQHEEHDPDPAIRKLRTELCVKAELRCLVGRMLWTQVWGRYVSPCKVNKDPGDKEKNCTEREKVSWWWEDEVCMAECLQLGTFWEYHTIEAVRGS